MDLQTSEQRDALIGITSLAVEDLTALWALVSDADRAEEIESLCNLYGLAAGTLAADWYDELRDQAEVTGRFITEPALLPTAGLFRSLIDRIDEAPPGSGLVIASGEVQRVVANAHRDTITELSGRDRAAGGWRREGVGGNCDFCTMLIGRGAVYSEGGSRFASHPHCNCIATPAFDGGQSIGVMPYSKPTDRRSPQQRAKSAARVRAWIRENQDQASSSGA